MSTTPLTPEELLKPRYEVIADFPDSKIPVGTILQLEYRPNNGNVWGTEIEGTPGIWDEGYIKDYPHIFKELGWWEKRSLDEMPEYVSMQLNEGKVVIKVSGKQFLDKDFMRWKFGGHSLNDFLPATESDYHLFINNQQ